MATSKPRPFFSVLITAYNREVEIRRCLQSCLAQSFGDLEVVVVDDASTDETPAVLAAIDDPRLRVVTHERNRGISPARATAVDHARGEWLVMLDSDWELLPGSLARLRELIRMLPPGVRVVRSRLRLDDGTISPAVMPAERITDYHGRLRWLEMLATEGGSSDASHCIHRAVLEEVNYPTDRRGAIETLWETNLARRETSLWTSETLGLQHVDAPNSTSRDPRIGRLLRDAPDQLWMAEGMLAQHGSELARHAPHYRRWLVESAAREAFLAGERRKGVHYTWAAARSGASPPKISATLVLGITSPTTLAAAKVLGRRWRARRAGRTPPRWADGR